MEYEHEVIAVFSSDENHPEFPTDDIEYSLGRLTVAFLPNISMEHTLKNIARHLVSVETSYLLFLDKEVALSKEFLLNRVKGMRVEPVVGIIGELAGGIDDETFKTLKAKFLKPGWLHLLDEDFTKRCCLRDGSFRNVKEGSMSTSLEVWDKVGGYGESSQFPNLEFQARVQCLGYEILVQ